MSNIPDEPDMRSYVISELDQILAGLSDDNEAAYERARDWLSELVLDGDWDVIATMLRGWQREMAASLERERTQENP